jgi:large subunit ribosomal protein L5
MARLSEYYKSDVLPELKQKFGRENLLSLPRLEKIVINMGVGSATQDKKELADASSAMALIAGQKPVITKARKSVANFRLREGQAIGCKVTLRGERMYEFMDRLLSLALPRVRDFRGISSKAFDGRGNYSLGLNEYGVFPELNPDKFTRTQGMNIVFVTSTENDDEGRELLRMFGMPFKNENTKA